MRQICIAAVERAAGRALTQKETQGIEQRISKQAHALARQDPAAWRQLSDAQRLDRAAQAAIQELTAEAQKQKQRLALQIKAHDALERQTGQWQGGRLNALQRLIAATTDGKGSFRSVETLAQSIRVDALRQMTEVFEAIDPRLFGFLENKEGVLAFTKAAFGETQGIDPKIVKAAEAWRDTAEAMRQQFNQAGGQVGKLESWHLPQHHAQLKVAKAGADQWVSDIFPLLDRKQYVRDDGQMMDDAELRAFLGEAWRTIATDGRNKLEPGKRTGSGMMANRNAEARSIHYKDAESYLKYQSAYGEKGLLQVMVDHVSGMANDVAAVESFGPNPQLTFEYFRDKGLKEAALTDPARVGRAEEQAVKLTNLWNTVMGVSPPTASEGLARAFEATRNWLVSSRLGGAVISSIADEGTIINTARVNRLPVMQVFANELRAMNLGNKEELRQARRAGLALDTAIGDLNRWGTDTLTTAIPAKLAHATMRASLLNTVTDVRRRAFGVTMMDGIGHLTRSVDSLAKLDADDHQILLSKGLTEQDWQIWRLAQPENWGSTNDTVLTPDSIYDIPSQLLHPMLPGELVQAGGPALDAATSKLRRDAALKLIGTVAEEVDMAVITPKALERNLVAGGLQRGTWKGELTRSVMLFKMTPLAAVLRHFQRGLGQNTTGAKALYVAQHLAMTTVLGAAAMQIKELVAGRDPKPLLDDKHAAQNWAAAFLQGGGIGLFGDFLFSGVTRHETSPFAAMLGPVVGMAEEIIKLTQGNIVEAAQGKDTHLGAELIRFAKSNMPGANLWYTKAALDHLVVNQLQEFASPGYLRSMMQRGKKEFGQSWWWAPDDATPERGPDLGRAVGE